MPLHSCWEPAAGLQLGLWQIVPGELNPGDFERALQRNSSAPSADQKMSVAALLNEMQQNDICLEKDEFGKPYIPQSIQKISISHSPLWAFIGMRREREIGVDVELFRPQLIKAATRFLSEAELEAVRTQEKEIAALALAWSAKESVYKWYGKKQLDWRKQIHLQIGHSGKEGVFEALLQTTEEQVLMVHYRFLEDAVLTWAVESV